jgi:glycyl-tRNA synthetase beta chain
MAPITAGMYPRLLLEIGTEEIPARFLPEAMAKLKENAAALFSGQRIPFGEINAYATPRRLALIAEVAPEQFENEKEVWGPPVNVAFDKEGKPTKAAEAFAKSNGKTVEALLRKEKGKGTYLVASVKEAAAPIGGLLPELLQKLVLSLTFPKSMRWGDGNIRFPRPIHWILSIYNNKPVEFGIEFIKSGVSTRGHRFLSPVVIDIKDDRKYFSMLRDNFVVLDPEERKNMIIDGARRLASSIDASVVEDDALLNHVSYLVEYPVPVIGDFPKEYLDLPEELLITVMKGHQKYFAIRGNNGKLTNRFIVVGNTKAENAEMVARGAQKVIRARFEDARFYYEEDKKVTLTERLEGLKKVIFHDKLGTVYAKTERMAALAKYIAQKTCPSAMSDAETAGRLAKSDLISGVVFEFPELQGIMGSYYAKNDGLGKEIALAVSEHYLPAFSGDRIPATGLGVAVSLADKIDNIASFFMIGMTPSGAEDPFALRRQALGIIAILSQTKNELLLADLFMKGLEPYPGCDRRKIIDEILSFLEQRLAPLYQSMGYPYDAIAAVTHFVRTEPVVTIRDRAEALVTLKKAAEYELFLQLMKRINNIAPKAETPDVDCALFTQKEEKALWTSFSGVKPVIGQNVAARKYADAMAAIKTLAAPINTFFDKVLVMDKDESIKQNRLALIKDIQTTAFSIADFSKLV